MTTGILTLEFSRGLDEDQRHQFRRVKFGQHLCGEVAQTRRPLIVANVHLLADEATAVARTMGIRAYAGLPLIVHGRLYGTVALGSIQNAEYADADISLLKTWADQFAATLDRARLLQSLRASEGLYRSALARGPMGAWETDLVAKTRDLAGPRKVLALFGLALAGGRGQVGDGEADEFKSALHPDDRHLVKHFRELADKQESFCRAISNRPSGRRSSLAIRPRPSWWLMDRMAKLMAR